MERGLILKANQKAPLDGGAKPDIVLNAGPKAGLRFREFFTANIRNPNTRRAYYRACCKFFHWAQPWGLDLQRIGPMHVAAYVERIQKDLSKPSVKQALAAIKMLFDWLVVGQVVFFNPASSVRGPRHSIKKGKTPVLSADEAWQLLDSINTKDVVGLRDRAIIALMTYTFARVGAAIAMDVEDYYVQGRRWGVRLHEKCGKLHEMPAHHNLEEYVAAYIEGAGIANAPSTPLFRTTVGKTRKLTDRRLAQSDVYLMVRRRAIGAGIATKIGNHSFRASGISPPISRTAVNSKLRSRMANHESARTTGLYDRRR